jgi:CBS domain-containing protein
MSGQMGQMVGIRRMTKSLNNISARDVMTTPATYVMDQTPIQEVARLLLREGISAAPVLNEGGHLVGIVSEGDLVRRRSGLSNDRRSWWLDLFEADTRHNQQFLNYLQHHGLRAQDVMTRDVVAVTEDTPISLIADLLERHQIKRVPVTSAGKVIGIVSRADLLKAISRAFPVQHRPPHRNPAMNKTPGSGG